MKSADRAVGASQARVGGGGYGSQTVEEETSSAAGHDAGEPAFLPPIAAAVRLIAAAATPGVSRVIHVASDERRAEDIARLLQQIAPDIEVVLLPPWDCLPYDRASPSRESMGRRMEALSRLERGAQGSLILVASPEAAIQKLPPPAALAGASLSFAVGDRVDSGELEAYARRTGYLVTDLVDEPGDLDIRSHVIDVFPAGGEAPLRLELDGGRIADIRVFDPASQRTIRSVADMALGPASEVIIPGEDAAEPVERRPGLEHGLAQYYPRLESLFDYARDAAISLDPEAEARRQAALTQLQDAYQAQLTFRDEAAPGIADAILASPAALREGVPTDEARRSPARPESLYLDEAAWREGVGGRLILDLTQAPAHPVQDFVVLANPVRALVDFIAAERDAGRRVVLVGAPEGLKALTRRLTARIEDPPVVVAGWPAVLQARPGALLALEADALQGFADPKAKVTVVAAAQVVVAPSRSQATGGVADLAGQAELRIGDTVIHEDHGVGVLRGLEPVTVNGLARDTVRLEYNGGADLMVPVEELAKVWRYGSEEEAVHIDRLNTDAWSRRRSEAAAGVLETAKGLVELARVRNETQASRIAPPRAAYERFVRRFPYTLTTDQAAAISAVLADLASGRPMDRLVCGDVGFGKTEVALRAAAAVLLAGRQVAVVAPTTVLVRQHLETFQRRFAELDVRIGLLSRFASPAETKAVKQGLASGDIGLVIATQALAGKDVAFADLGLLVIDEEQRFGARMKSRLRALSPHGHVLTLTATPIPRTLQMAMVGVQEVSVIATPPARRRPIRTFLAPFDTATVRNALVRERARDGQSFVVAPRIEDIEPLRAQLAAIVPQLEVLVAHGDLEAADADDVMVRFAHGHGDVLLATNIIESGLDVPRANTMLVWRPDRFGLAQLHQLRGRVGRGRAQGVAYLLSDPDHELSEETRARLSALQAFDRLGAGLALSARDLDLRGAGDLVGEEQAGHLKLIGLGLYQSLLERAVRAAKGETVDDEVAPELSVEVAGAIPEAYVAEPEMRINLYARLSRLRTPGDVRRFEDELEDRFGELPPETQALLALAELQQLSRALRIAKLTAGPKAVAITFAEPPTGRLAETIQARGDLLWRDGRLIYAVAAEPDEARLNGLKALLNELAEGAETKPKVKTYGRPS